MIIPIRDYQEAALSRVSNGVGEGGLWCASSYKEQLQFFHKIMAEYLVEMVQHDIPTLFLDFKRMVSDPEYLYKKLIIYLPMDEAAFKEAYIKATDDQVNRAALRSQPDVLNNNSSKT